MFFNRYLVKQLVQNLHHNTHAFSLIKLKLNFQKPKTINLWFGLDTSKIFFWFRFMGEKFKEFIADFNVFNPNIQLMYQSSKKSIAFLYLYLALCNALHTLNQLIDNNTFNILPHILSIEKDLLYLVKLKVSVEFVLVKTNFKIIASK